MSNQIENKNLSKKREVEEDHIDKNNSTKNKEKLSNVIETPSNNKNKNSNSSRVLLLNNLAVTVTEQDIENLLNPFTKQKPKIYLQATYRRAFVELSDEENAKAALQYFLMHNVQLKGSNVSITMSKRDSVTTTDENANNAEKPFKILLTSVTNLVYPVDIDLIHFLFSKYGFIQKIVTFSRGEDAFQAFVQFKYYEQAKSALTALHNRNIYHGCNKLQIQPSRLKDLIIKTNSSKSFDYTLQNKKLLNKTVNVDNVNNIAEKASNIGTSNYSKFSRVTGLGVLPTPNSFPNPFCAMGLSSLYNNSHSNSSMFMNTHFSNFFDKLPREMRDMNLESCNRNNTPVLICYHLPSDITVENLFNLFSLYGFVVRIKILRDKPDTALIQYSDPFYASIAYNYLQKVNINEHELQISFSRNLEVKLSTYNNVRRTSEGTRYINNFVDNMNENNEIIDSKTKTFQMKEQRYGTDDIEKYIRGAARPTATLFVANINENVTEQEIKNLFSPYGDVEKVLFKSPREGAKIQMAVVAMRSELEALNALMNLHNTCFQNKSIKVAFSKTVLN